MSPREPTLAAEQTAARAGSGDPPRIPLRRRPEVGPTPPQPRTPVTLTAAWPAIAVYAGLRGLGVLVLGFFADEQNRTLLSLLSRYDAVHYAGIVARGYDRAVPLQPDGQPAISNLAFFPLYPALTALVDPILPGGPDTAGILVSWLAGLAAAWGLFAVGACLRDRRTGVMLAGLWAVVPHGLVQSMGYTETLFTALAAWTLYAVLRRHWLTAGLLCALAGLTRPTGAALVAAVGLAALVTGFRRRDGWRPWSALVLAPLGLLGYVAWVGHRLGRADGYFYVQESAWRMSYDTGAYTVGRVRSVLTEPLPLAMYATTLVLLIALALLVILALDRVPWPLIVYAAVIVGLAFFGDGYFHAKARLTMPAFPLLLPIACALAAGRRRNAAVVLVTLAMVSAGYGVYLALVWTYSP